VHLTSTVTLRIEDPVPGDTFDAVIQQIKGVRREYRPIKELAA